jgi:hypothetical protein
VRDLAIKEMPLEEKYDRLLDDYLLAIASGYALHKELGVIDKSNDLWFKVQKKMLPKILGPVSKLLKVLSPDRTFKQVMNQAAYLFQTEIPLSNIELSWVSDREAVLRIKNCERLRRLRELVKKTGLNIDPKELCEIEWEALKEIAKEFGTDVTWELEENGCRSTGKLK